MLSLHVLPITCVDQLKICQLASLYKMASGIGAVAFPKTATVLLEELPRKPQLSDSYSCATR